jgi:hypothetical protein
MRRVLCLAPAALLVFGCAGPAATAAPAPTATPTPAPSGATFSVANGTTVPVAIAVNGTVVETVPAGTTEDPIRAPLPPRPWTVEARSPSGRVLVTMTVAANDPLSDTYGRVGSAVLACGWLDLWAGAPILGEPAFSPDPSKPCD